MKPNSGRAIVEHAPRVHSLIAGLKVECGRNDLLKLYRCCKKSRTASAVGIVVAGRLIAYVEQL